MTHEELSQAYLFQTLLDNPMNDPDKRRAFALEMLLQQVESRCGAPLEVEELFQDTDPQTDTTVPYDFADLEDLPEADIESRSGESASDLDAGLSDKTQDLMHDEMRRRGAWFLNHILIPGPKYLAIGRSTYYIPFFQRLAVELGSPVYQSDYMEWLEPTHPEVSLAFYLRTAERIDVNLEGVSPDDLRKATIGSGRRVNKRHELPRPFMTSWEINQIYHTDHLIPVFWHTGGAMSHSEAFEILGARVPKERIIED